jgi:hypothetical protein
MSTLVRQVSGFELPQSGPTWRRLGFDSFFLYVAPIAPKLQLPTEALPRVYDWRGNCRDLKSFWGEPKKEGDAKNLLSLFKYLLILIFITITLSSQ